MHKSAEHEVLLGELAEQFTARQRRGEKPDIEQYAREHPGLAKMIRETFPALQLMANLEPDDDSDEDSGSLTPLTGRLGDYRIFREIGRGGMGVVYEAEQVSLGRQVALKVLPLAAIMDQRQLQRFKNEAQAAAQLHHSNIVPVFSVGSDRGVHYYAMQYIEGHNLAEVIAQLRQLERSEIGVEGPVSSQALAVSSGLPDQDAAVADQQPTQTCASQFASETLNPTPSDTSPVAVLSTQSSTKNPLFYRTVTQLAIQAADALDYAHQSGVLHRDIKPSNLLLDGQGTLWIADFGLARIESGAGMTATGDIVGTLRYMSPEQALAKRVVVDCRTDIYSLGVTFYELLTLEPVFQSRDKRELLGQIAFDEPRAPRKVNKSIPQELETIVLKAIAKSPAERYGTAKEFADDLRRHLEDKPIQAKRPMLVQRLAKWSRRHKPIVASAAATAASVLLVVAIGAALMAGKEHDKRIAAEQATSRETALRQEKEEFLVSSYVDKAQALCEQGEVGRGMLWFAHSLRTVPENATDLERVIRANLAAWRLRLHSLGMLVQHQSQVRAVVFSPDGLRILTGCSDGTAQLWDATTGRAIGNPLRHPHTVHAVAFSPDGSRILTGSEDGKARLFHIATQKPIGEAVDIGGPVRSVAFSPDGSRFATASRIVPANRDEDGVVRVWDAATLETVGEPFAPVERSRPMAIRFCREGLRVVVLSDDKFQLWDVEKSASVGPPVAPWGRQYAAAISPEGTRFATVSEGATIQLWDTEGRHAAPPMLHGGVVSTVAFSPDGSRLLSGGNTRAARLWDAETGQLIGDPLWQRSTVFSVAFNPQGTRVLTGSDDGSVRLWNVARDDALGQPIQHKHKILAAAFSPDGLRILTETERDDRLQLRDATTGQAVGAPLGQTVEQIKWFAKTSGLRMRFSPDGSQVVTWWGNRIDVATGQCSGSLRSQCAVFSPDGSRILAGTIPRYTPQPGVALLLDATTMKFIGKPLQHVTRKLTDPKMAAVSAVAFSPDGSRMLTGGYDGTTRFWDAATLEPIGPPLIHQSEIKSLAYSPDGRRMLTGFADGTVRLWDLDTLKPLGAPLHHKEIVCDVAFSPDGSRFLTCSVDHTAQLWDTSTLKPIGAPLEREGSWGSVSFSPDGSEILVEDKGPRAPRLWQCPPWLLEGDPKRIVLWAQVVTGLELDDSGGIGGLDGPTWQKLHQQLQRLGGPPTPASSPAPVAKAETDFSRSMEHALRARQNAEQNQWEKAATDFAAAIKLSGNSRPLRSQLAVWLLKLARTQLARDNKRHDLSELFEKLAHRPGLPQNVAELRFELGELLMSVGTREEAAEQWRRALHLSEPFVEYKVRIETVGSYQLYLRPDAHDNKSDTVYVSIVEQADGPGGSVPDWYWYGFLGYSDFATASWQGSAGFEKRNFHINNKPAIWSISAPGEYTIRFFMREDGAAIDAFVLQLADLPAPSGDGPDESPRTPDKIFVESQGQVVVEAEHFSSRTTAGEQNWMVVPHEDRGVGQHSNFRGTGYVQALPDSGRQFNFRRNPTLWLVLAAELAENEQARHWYGQAARRMEQVTQSSITAEEVRRFGAEVAKLLAGAEEDGEDDPTAESDLNASEDSQE